MKILFFYPHLDQRRNNYDIFGPRIPLGLAQIIAVFHGSHVIKVIDEQIEKKTIEKIAKEIDAFSPDIVCISMTHIVQYHNSFKFLVDFDFSVRPKIIVGGITYKWFAMSIMNHHPKIDFCILREGELKIKNLIQDNFCKPELIPDLIYRKNDKPVLSEVIAVDFNMDDLDYPVFEYFKMHKYGRSLFNPEATPIISIEFSRGCNNACAFCDAKKTFGKFKHYSAAFLFDKIVELKNKYKTKFFFFNDSNILCKHTELIELANMLIDKKVGVHFFSMASIDTIYRFPDLNLLYRAGFKYILIGLESSDQAFLKGQNKACNIVNDFFSVTRKLQKIGFFVQFTLIAGAPGMPLSQVQEDYKLLKKLKPNFFTYSYYTPYYELLCGEMNLEQTLKKRFSELDTGTPVMPNASFSPIELARDLKRMKFKLYIYLLIHNVGKKHFLIMVRMIAYSMLMGGRELVRALLRKVICY